MESGETERRLRNLTYRLNPRYQLVDYNVFSADQKSALRDLLKDPDFWGVLLPRPGSSLPVKSVCRNTHRLLACLIEPNELPSFLLDDFGGDQLQTLRKLVMDRVLEIAVNDAFVSGSDVALSLAPDRNNTLSFNSGDISHAAIRYGMSLSLSDPKRLAARLYFFNRIPWSRRWQTQFPSRVSLAEQLGILGNGDNPLSARSDWKLTNFEAADDAWFLWRRRNAIRNRNPQAVYKLYINPFPTHVVELFHMIRPALGRTAAFSFKLGRDALSLLRPDKLVVYFEELSHLHAGADLLRRGVEATEFPVQRVPFTTPITPNGMFSWGVDLPPPDDRISWMEEESWRIWIANRVAIAILMSQDANVDFADRWNFIVQRLQVEEIDVSTWTLSRGLEHLRT